MSKNSAISWCDATWQVVAGCSVASPGCAHCYSARLLATRLKHLPWTKGLAVVGPDGTPHWTGEVRTRPDQLAEPLTWRDPLSIFVGDRGDLFHPAVPDAFLLRLFDVLRMNENRDKPHTILLLTKRAERMRDFASRLMWDGSGAGRVYLRDAGPANLARMLAHVWWGVTAEDQQRADKRIPALLATPAAHRWVSVEPMIGPVSLSDVAGPDGSIIKPLVGITWGRRPITGTFTCGNQHAKLDAVIVGGESGPKARQSDIEWHRSVIRQCADAGVPCFEKQLGSNPRPPMKLKSKTGKDPSEWPADLRVRELAWEVTRG